MAGISGDQDNGYSSFEDETDAGPTRQAVVIDAVLSLLRARANCGEDSFVRHLSTSLLSRMARNIFRRWDSTRNAADVEQVPDFLELVFKELSRFAQRSEIAEEYDRRNSRGSVEHDDLSPKEDIGELESCGENKSDLQQKEFGTNLSNSESVGELLSSEEAKISDNLERKPEDSRIAQDAAGIADALQSSVEHASTEYLEMKSLGSSISSLSFDLPSDFQCSEASTTSEVCKNDKEPNSGLPSTGSGTSISSGLDQVITAQEPELSHPRPKRNITPEESSNPSDELPTSIEENPPTDDAHNTGAMPKSSQKDKGRHKKRTRQVVESLTNRQIASLTRLEITLTDALELLIQLSVSLDRLDRLINGSRSRVSDMVNESVLLQFFKDVEYCRTIVEMENRVPVDRDDSQTSSVPEITEHPRRDPKDSA